MMVSKPENGSASVIEHRAYARVGLLGNPSDVYFGRTISASLGNFWASARLQPSDDLVIVPHPTHDLVQFGSLSHLVNRLQNEGYYGGVRLLMAICKVFHSYCKDNKIDLHEGNFTLSYDTNIPRQTGLSGSSAIVCATLSCLLDFYTVRHLIKVEVRPNLILNAEKELGIVAGLQDRVAQVYGGLVYMDFNKKYMDDLGHGIYTPMDISLLPPLYLIYAENPSDSGKVHSLVRQKWLNGDKFIVESMEEVANVALEGRTALLEKDYAKLAGLMNRNFDLRRQMFGDEVLSALNIEMVEVARRLGAASKFTGSGGAAVVFCPGGPSQVKLLEDEWWTSFTVCGKLRRLVKVKKVGHAGTLDPMATGLLIVCVGKATKLVDGYQGMIKGYSGIFRLGEATSTWDADSPVIQREPWEHIKDENIKKTAATFCGEIWQVPPMFSAIKVGGEKMYEKARRGESIELSPRRISIFQFDIERSLDDRQNLIFRVTCSKGTYIRSLCADLGKALGSCAHLTALRRDSIGEYLADDAWDFKELEEEITKGYL